MKIYTMAKKTTTDKRKPGRPKGTTKYKETAEKLSYSQLDPIDRAMLAMVGTKPAIANTALARAVGLNPRTTKKRRDRGIFQRELERIQQPALDKCREAQSEAADVLIDLLKSPDEKIRLAAAQSLLKPLLPSTAIVKHDSTIDLKINNMTPNQLDTFIKEGLKILDEPIENIIEAEIIEENNNAES